MLHSAKWEWASFYGTACQDTAVVPWLLAQGHSLLPDPFCWV